MEKVKRAAGYIRISSEKQEEGTSLDSQRSRIEKRAKDEGYELVEIFQDIYSGANTRDRPGFQEMLQAAKDKEFSILLFTKLDRLGRSLSDILESWKLLVEKLGLELISLDDPAITTTGISGKIVRAILGLVAEIERDLIRTRTKAGRMIRWKANECFLGSVPYGYRKKKNGDKNTGEIIKDEDQAKVYHLMVDLYLHKRFSLADIAIELNKQGIKSPSALRNKKKPGAKNWSAQAIHQVLTNPCYVGEKTYNQIARNDKGRRIVVDQPEEGRKPRRKTKGLPATEQGRQWAKKPMGEWMVKQFPPLIEKRYWNAIQARMKKRRRRPAAQPELYKDHFLLGGLAVCNECGALIRKRARKSPVDGLPRRTYLCCNYSTTAKERSYTGKAKCDLPSINAEDADARAFNQIVHLLTHPSKYAALWLKDVNAEEVEEKKAKLAGQLKEIEGKIARGLEYIMETADPDRRAKHEAATRKLEEQAALIEQELTKVIDSAELIKHKALHLKDFKKGMASRVGFKNEAVFAAYLQGLPFADKRAVLESIISPESGGKILFGFVKATDFVDQDELEAMPPEDRTKPLKNQPLAITLDFDVDPQKIEQTILGLDRSPILESGGGSGGGGSRGGSLHKAFDNRLAGKPCDIFLAVTLPRHE